jgi:hypothetical protein
VRSGSQSVECSIQRLHELIVVAFVLASDESRSDQSAARLIKASCRETYENSEALRGRSPWTRIAPASNESTIVIILL